MIRCLGCTAAELVGDVTAWSTASVSIHIMYTLLVNDYTATGNQADHL